MHLLYGSYNASTGIYSGRQTTLKLNIDIRAEINGSVFLHEDGRY